MTAKQANGLGTEVAKIVRNAIGALNHTNIGFATDHDYLADPFIDDIMQAFKKSIDELVLPEKTEFRDSQCFHPRESYGCDSTCYKIRNEAIDQVEAAITAWRESL